MYSYTPTDLLSVKDVASDFYQWFHKLITAAYKDADEALNFRSNVVKDYFLEICTPETKRHIRLTLKFFLIYAVSLIVLSPIIDPENSVKNITEATQFVAIGIMCYLFSMRKNTHFVYSTSSILFILITFGYILLKCSDLQVNLENHYTPASQVCLLMFAILPIPFEVSFCVCCFFVFAFEISIFNRLKFGAGYKNYTVNTTDDKSNVLERIHTFPFTCETPVIISYIKGQLMLWLSCIFSGSYLYLSNQLRLRASFLRLGENVKAQLQVNKAIKEQIHYIGTIVPYQMKTDYINEKNANKHDPLWLYSRLYENVTILFACVTGFTKLSLGKSAVQVITLLSDLFSRFNELCLLTNCIKMGTLGTNYYCVSGCPSRCSDHARSCVEMGLGMCRIVVAFNKNHLEDINLRVGVHTGLVNAAIMGNLRFKFDVYSNDVLIANDLEISGEPGFVHISETTYEHVCKIYTIVPGNDIEVKREVKYGMAGLKLTTHYMKTYFIHLDTAYIFKSSAKIEKHRNDAIQILADRKTLAGDNAFDESKTTRSEVTDDQVADHKDEDIRFVDALRKDPDKQIKLLDTPPLWPINLTFMDSKVEYHYHAHTRDEIHPIYIDSVKLAPLIDCLASLLFTTFITAACHFFDQKKFMREIYIIVSVFSIGILNTILIAWSSLKFASLLKNQCTKCIFLIISHYSVKNFQSVLMCAIPCVICLLMFDCQRFHKDHIYTSFFCSVCFFSLFGHAIYVSSFAWINTLSSTVFVVIFLHLLISHPECIEDKCYYEKCPTYSCMDLYDVHFDQFWESYIWPVCISYCLNLFIIFLLNRENEKNLRLCFFVTREAQNRREESEKAAIESQELLHNIIPAYVLKEIVASGGDIKTGRFSYAVNVSSVAIAFACISNFFSNFYREDYKGGTGGLQLLNKIICNFDDIMRCPQFACLDKIKSIHDSYMFGSGLNKEEVIRSKDSTKHLRDLLHYVFEIQRSLEDFNNDYVFGNIKFEMKLGCSFGSVIAGVIGTSKPLYDIYGEAVTVARQMCAMSSPGLIQVPVKVVNLLRDSNLFKFTLFGTVYVKGLGDISAFVCEEKVTPKLKPMTI